MAISCTSQLQLKVNCRKKLDWLGQQSQYVSPKILSWNSLLVYKFTLINNSFISTWYGPKSIWFTYVNWKTFCDSSKSPECPHKLEALEKWRQERVKLTSSIFSCRSDQIFWQKKHISFVLKGTANCIAHKMPSFLRLTILLPKGFRLDIHQSTNDTPNYRLRFSGGKPRRVNHKKHNNHPHSTQTRVALEDFLG